MTLRKFRFHWLGSSKSYVDGEGSSVEDAFSRLGYGAGALAAVDYYEEITEFKLIPLTDFIQWEVEFWQSSNSKHLRLGQAFLNTHYPHLANPDIFYDTDVASARRKILEKYVDLTVG